MGTGTSGTGGYTSSIVFRKIGLDLSSITRHVAMTATLPEDSGHHQTDTAHGLTDVSTCHFHASSLPNQVTFGVYWRCRAGELVARAKVETSASRCTGTQKRHEDDVSIMVSGSPDFGERKTRGEVRRVEVSNRQQTNYSGHHEKAPFGRGGGDRAVIVQGQGRTRHGETAPIGFGGRNCHFVGRGQSLEPSASPRSRRR